MAGMLQLCTGKRLDSESTRSRLTCGKEREPNMQVVMGVALNPHSCNSAEMGPALEMKPEEEPNPTLICLLL